MAISTYSELQTAIASWLHRADLTTVIPDFISLCEATMQRNLTVGEQETTTTISLAAGATSITLPTGFQKLRRLRYLFGNAYVDLWPIALSPSYSSGTVAGPPRALSFQGSVITLHGPTDQAYTIVLDAYVKFTPLSAAAPTNWILTDHPDAYLYGSLMQSAPFLGTDNRIDLWSNAFVGVMNEIIQDDYQRRMSQNQMVSDVAFMARPRGDRRTWQ